MKTIFTSLLLLVLYAGSFNQVKAQDSFDKSTMSFSTHNGTYTVYRPTNQTSHSYLIYRITNLSNTKAKIDYGITGTSYELPPGYSVDITAQDNPIFISDSETTSVYGTYTLIYAK